VVGTRRFSIQRDPEAHGLAIAGGAKHQMQVAALEAEADAAAELIQRGGVRVHHPAAVERPLVDGECRGSLIVAYRIRGEVITSEVIGAGIADAGFRRTGVIARAGRPSALRIGFHVSAGQVILTGCGEQRAGHISTFLVATFAVVVMPDPPLGVGEVIRRPILVVEALPDRVSLSNATG
jgi:hypothetical protein